MLGITILLGFHLLGMLLQELCHLPLPANLIGLILFTFALYTGIVKLEWVEETAQFLTKHMMLFFIPFLVGTIAFLPFIGAHFVSIIVSLVVSTFLVVIVTGWVTKRCSRQEEQGEKQFDA